MDFSKLSTANWYPGHMRKAERQIREKLKLVDCIVELVDARAPYSSTNANLADVMDNKAHVLLLTKSDLADAETTRQWLNYFRSSGKACMSIHHRQQDLAGKITKLIIQTADEYRISKGATTPRLRAVRAMIIGLPNVGKSSLINAMVNRKQTRTGPTPGITRHQQWVVLRDGLELLDTPGVMVPRVSDPETGLRLGLTACIKDAIVGVELLTEYLLYQWTQQNRQEYLQRYKLEGPPRNHLELLNQVGVNTGTLKTAGEVEMTQTASLILQDYREGRMGRMSLETPDNLTDH